MELFASQVGVYNAKVFEYENPEVSRTDYCINKTSTYVEPW